ncbi:facilitated trehalose transporter Tret1-2 homolog [Cylas formicarius]|uniref:facilitated trehalose transporter Tret1-2 homolog n=1 Tax=Cylas formicarius TaxID=197179 RepID=UPI002958660F|nr:facilitated trehalose transporter Tret1-2 homolog [Cylas formicarius]XP_060533329.1 facilitated trehalose transporter Tret1-2 homolog [Cylas formicarius]
MDPIGASCFSLHLEDSQRAKLEEQQRQEEQFSEAITSIRSLSRYDGRTFKTLCPQVLAALIAASFHVVVGISLAYSGILIPQLNDTSSGIAVTKAESSWIASTIVIVAPIGGITGGFLMDTFGRLNTLKLAVVPSVIGWVAIAMAQNVPMLIVGRIFTGLASSWGTSPAVVYITEIARVDVRGSLVSFGPALASLGMVLAFLKGWFLNWRLVAWMSLGYSILPLILIQVFVPESPPWLVAKGKIEEAAKSLRYFNKYQPQPEHRTETLAELQLALLQKEHQIKLEEDSKRGSGILTIAKEFLKATGYKPLFILFGLFFFQQYSGIYITLFYSVQFFQAIGSSINPYLASTLIGTVRFSMSCANTYMMRTFYRRPLLMVSGLGMCLCMAFSGLFTQWILEGSSTQNWVPTTLLLLYVITSMVGLLPIPWTMTAELFPIEIRGVAHSVAYSAANLLMFASVQMYYVLLDWWGGIVGIQWFFAVISILASAYVFIFVPETHGKKLSEITNYFSDSGAIYILSRKKDKEAQKRRTQSRVPKRDIVKSGNQNEKLINSV